jgi:hypothetical protein
VGTKSIGEKRSTIQGMLDRDPELTTLMEELRGSDARFSVRPDSAYQKAGARDAILIGTVVDAVRGGKLEAVAFLGEGIEARAFVPAKAHWQDYAGERSLRAGSIDGTVLCFRRDQWVAWLASKGLPLPPSPSEPPAARASGRPRKWDWDGMYCELIAIADRPDGLPGDQAEAEKLVARWFNTNTGDEPAESQIREKIGPIYQRKREGRKR